MTCGEAGRKREGGGQELHSVQRRRSIGERKEDEAGHRMCVSKEKRIRVSIGCKCRN